MGRSRAYNRDRSGPGRDNRRGRTAVAPRALSPAEELALARARMLHAVADMAGGIVGGRPFDSAQGGQMAASEGSGTVTEPTGAPNTGMVVDTAHRGASQNARSMLTWGVASPVDPNLETVYDLMALRSRTRDLHRNNPIAAGALGKTVLSVIGPGLKLHPRINRAHLGLTDEEGDAWESEVAHLFGLWAGYEDADARRTEDFYSLQALAFLSILHTGEVLALLPMIARAGTICDLRIKLVEGDRLSNPHLTYDTFDRMAGIEVDVDGAPTAYWLETTPTWLNVVRTWERVKVFGAKSGRRNVLHLFRQDRVGQKRGVPVLSPVIETLKQITRYGEAELMAAVVTAMLTVFVKSQLGEADILGQSLPEPETSINADEQTIQLGNGAVVGLADGEDIQVVNPTRPNAQYEPFVMAHVKQIGMALGIPYEVLVQHFSSSYSASRAALLEAWRMFDERREWFARRFCQPIYEEWLAVMVADGRIAAPGYLGDIVLRRAWAQAQWIGPTAGQIDPVKEVNASTLRVENGFSTIEEETRRLTGGNWERNFQQRAKELARAEELGVNLASTVVVEAPADAPEG